MMGKFTTLLAFSCVVAVCGCAGGSRQSSTPTSAGGEERSESGGLADAPPNSEQLAGEPPAPEPQASPADGTRYGNSPGTEPERPEGYGYEYADGAASRQKKGAALASPEAPTPAAEAWLPDASQPSEAGRAPLLIYDAVLTLAVFETKKQLETIEKRAKEAGGYLVKRSDAEITVRVPAQAFGATLETMAKLGDELHREVSVKDVTSEFTDLQIRLQNARAVRGRLEELLAKATKVEEALAVERELERVSGEIERMLGQLKLMSELVSFSTITVRFQPHAVDQVQSRVNLPFPWLHELGLPNLLAM